MRDEVCVAGDVSCYHAEIIEADSDEHAILATEALANNCKDYEDVGWYDGVTNIRIVSVYTKTSEGKSVCIVEGVDLPNESERVQQAGFALLCAAKNAL